MKSVLLDSNLTVHFIFCDRWNNPHTRGSAIMRAFVPASYLTKIFKIKTTVGKRLDPKRVSKKDIVIFVKDPEHPDISIAKNMNCIVAYDQVDNFGGIGNRNNFDVFISSSQSHVDWMTRNYQISSEKFVIIDHLSTNIQNLTADVRNHGQKDCFGFVEPDADRFRYHDKLRIYIENFGAKFVWKDTLRLPHEFCENLGHKFLFDYYKDVTVGFAVYDSSTTRGQIRQLCKPSTKLSAWSSYGIPAILTEQMSYKPYLEKFDFLNNLLTKSEEQTYEIVDRFVKDQEFYKKARETMLLLREDFHMKRTKELYIDQILLKVS